MTHAANTPRSRRNGRRLMAVASAVALTLLVVGAFAGASRLLRGAPQAAKTAPVFNRGASSSSASPQAPPPPSNPKTKRDRILAAAYALRGVPYRWGAKGPHAYDCSGFTKAAYRAGGVTLPDGSFNQARGDHPLRNPAVLTPGDLIFYRWAGGGGVSHVTMYAGDGWVIGTGTPGQPAKVAVYALSDDLVNDGRTLTYRHIRLPDER